MYHSFSSWTRGSTEGGTRMKRSAWIAFLTAETLLYLSFLFLDLRTGADTKWLKFASILMVALMSFQLNDKIVTAALCLTALADVFLLVLDQWYIVGLLLFCIVQLLYSLHLHSQKMLSMQIVLLIFSAILVLAYRRMEPLAVGYITVFLLNLFHAASFAIRAKGRQTILFAFGLLLFFCCDLCVGYYNIGEGALWEFSRIAMWGFYLPGQVMILLSAVINEGELK